MSRTFLTTDAKPACDLPTGGTGLELGIWIAKYRRGADGRLRLPNKALRYTGILLVLLSIIHFAALLIVESKAGHKSLIGSMSLMAVPAMLLPGLGLVLAGIWMQHRRHRSPATALGRIASPRLPHIDLNLPRHRHFLIMGAGVSIVAVMVLGTAGLGAYEFVESTSFCTGVCHQAMRPEAVANQNSGHAAVACPSCHVAPGATGFIRSKISGMFEAVSVVRNSYSRPISVSLADLPGTVDTCEGCHRPERFYGDELITRPHFVSDEKNTEHTVSVVIKTGGTSLNGESMGSHWHANVNNKVQYALSVDRPNSISWVSAVGPDGKTVEYFSEDDPISSSDLAVAEKRRMDCLDCHDRTGHVSMSPDQAIDTAIANGEIDRRLPYIRKVTLDLVTRPYRTDAEAVHSIANGIAEFYAARFPQLQSRQAEAIRMSTEGAQEVWTRNVFPDMNASWGTYPDNIGHRNSQGCFRCHDDKHVSKDGLKIRQDCGLCHSLPVPEPYLAGDLASGDPGQPVMRGAEIK